MLSAYTFERSLKTGSLSEVAVVVHKGHGRRAVRKRLKPEIFPDSPSGQKLEHEAALLAKLNHASVVAFLDFSKDKATSTLLTEYVEGKNLAELLDTHGRLSPRVATHIALELARGLAYLHESGVIHAHLDPANVLCSPAGAVKLCDFGEAATPAEALRLGRQSRGTTAMRKFQSPEQNFGAEFDERADLYVLGTLLYLMLTGSTPMNEPGRAARSLESPNRGPSAYASSRAVPKALDALVSSLLAHDAGARPATARSVVETLTRLCERENYGDRGAAMAPLFEGRTARSIDDANRVARPPWLPFAAIGIGFIILAAGVQVFAGAKDGYASLGTAPLPLVPAEGGGLRVIARPWAEVWVDGQWVETTPFLRPIPLTAGPHFVTLRHPFAVDDAREVRIVRGQTTTVEATLHVNLADGSDAGIVAISRDADVHETPSHNPNIARPKLHK